VSEHHWRKDDTESSEPFGNDWLTNIHEIILPEPISSWPQGAGWWALLILIVACGLRWAWLQYRHWKANAYRRAGIERLGQLREQIESGQTQCLAQLPELVRQVALCVYPRRRVVALSGREWLDFLERSTDRSIPDILQSLAYCSEQQLREVGENQKQQLFDWIVYWIETHDAMYEADR
jgi:hypothetical protein